MYPLQAVDDPHFVVDFHFVDDFRFELYIIPKDYSVYIRATLALYI